MNRTLMPLARAVARAAMFLGLVAAPLAAQGDSTASAEKAATAGVYTDAQSKRGETAYKTYCVECHSAKAYTGEAFKLAWVTRTAFDFFEAIRTQMPESNPGSLARQDYADIVAYIISLNGYPTGPDELSVEDDGLKKVRLDTPPGGVVHDRWAARQLRGRRWR